MRLLEELTDLSDLEQTKAILLSSYMTFLRTFFQLRTGREFKLSKPVGRESHFITIAKELKAVFEGRTKRLIINVPPRYGKSEMMIEFVPWALANYPDSNFIYTSYAQSLASMQTQVIREIINLPAYKLIFGVELSNESSAKDNFRTNFGGTVFAAGAGGAITGRGAGIKDVDRFGGCVIIDDAHKPEEIHSDTMRQRINNWFYNTLQSRLNDKNTPIIAIGQMLHEDDLLANLREVKDKDGNPEWKVVCLAALDEVNNALYPEYQDKETLLKMKEEMPYVFASQYQQAPSPAGGGIFKEEWFIKLPAQPDIISTFITVDTAETDKTYNDATAFSFWGVYKIVNRGIDTGLYGIHWIDCYEIRCEPKDLENEFFAFYTDCMRFKVKPGIAVIEKKSTGVTLTSALKNIPALRVIDLNRAKGAVDKVGVRGGRNKIERFLQCQPYISTHRVTFTDGASHADMCIEHCRKITANDTHRHDDIADTMQMAIQCALIEETLLPKQNQEQDNMLDTLMQRSNYISSLRQQL